VLVIAALLLCSRGILGVHEMGEGWPKEYITPSLEGFESGVD
jgi:hypothetical protein